MRQKLEQIFTLLDTNHDGKVSFEEFKSGIAKEPLLVSAFINPASTF